MAWWLRMGTILLFCIGGVVFTVASIVSKHYGMSVIGIITFITTLVLFLREVAAQNRRNYTSTRP